MTIQPLTITVTEVAEDTEWDIACERISRPRVAHTHPCQGSGRAEWSLWLSCGCSPVYVLYCTACRDAVLSATGIHCDVCEFTFSPGSTAYCLVEPLSRRVSS
jgi:hypothetical protein